MSKLIIISHAVEMTMKTSLQSIAIHNVELFRQNYPSGLPFLMFIFKLARMVSEFLRFFWEELRNNTSPIIFIRRQRELRSIDEDVLFPGMTVHINIRHNVFILNQRTVRYGHIVSDVGGFSINQVTYQLFYGPYFRVQPRVWLKIPPIQVVSRHWGTIVTYNDSVDVDHRYDFENYPFSEFLGLSSIAH